MTTGKCLIQNDGSWGAAGGGGREEGEGGEGEGRGRGRGEYKNTPSYLLLQKFERGARLIGFQA